MNTDYIRRMLTAAGIVLMGIHAAAANTRPAECRPGEGNSPPWLTTLPASDQLAYTRQAWYQAWRRTTLDLCVSLPRLKTDNPGVTVVWQDNAAAVGLLFYGAGNHYYETDTVFSQGLAPISFDGSLALRPGFGTQSAFKSTSFSARAAALYAQRSTSAKHYVYIINAPGGVDVDKSLHRTPGNSAYEIAFPGGIQPGFVKGVFEVSQGKDAPIAPRYLRYTGNPHYAGPVKKATGVDVMVASAEPERQVTLSPVAGSPSDINTWHYPLSDMAGHFTRFTASMQDNRPADWDVTSGRVTAEQGQGFYATCATTDSRNAVDGMLIISAGPAYDPGVMSRPGGLCTLLSPTPPLVTGATACRDAASGEVRVKWNKPQPAEQVKGYRLYRLSQDGLPDKLLFTLTGADNTTQTLGQGEAATGTAVGITTLVEGVPLSETGAVIVNVKATL